MRLLLLRTSALGDIAHALPTLAVVRQRLPAAKIAWAVDEAFAPLLAGHPWIDELIPLPLRRARKVRGGSSRDFFRALARLRGFRAEVALELMGNHKGGVLAWLSGAERRIGVAAPWRRERGSGIWVNETVAVHRRHAIDRNLDLVEPLVGSVESATLGPELLPASGEESRPYLLIHPGAAWGNKQYPATSWGVVARRLREVTDLPVRIAQGPGEAELAAEVIRTSGEAAQIEELPSLEALVRGVRQATMVLGADSGPVHLAQVLGRKVLILHGPTDPARHGSYRNPQASLGLQLPCSFCHRRMAGPKPCLLALDPEAVVRRAQQLLASDEL